jgi:hypothetical protein
MEGRQERKGERESAKFSRQKCFLIEILAPTYVNFKTVPTLFFLGSCLNGLERNGVKKLRETREKIRF